MVWLFLTFLVTCQAMDDSNVLLQWSEKSDTDADDKVEAKHVIKHHHSTKHSMAHKKARSLVAGAAELEIVRTRAAEKMVEKEKAEQEEEKARAEWEQASENAENTENEVLALSAANTSAMAALSQAAAINDEQQKHAEWQLNKVRQGEADLANQNKEEYQLHEYQHAQEAERVGKNNKVLADIDGFLKWNQNAFKNDNIELKKQREIAAGKRKRKAKKAKVEVERLQKSLVEEGKNIEGAQNKLMELQYQFAGEDEYWAKIYEKQNKQKGAIVKKSNMYVMREGKEVHKQLENAEYTKKAFEDALGSVAQIAQAMPVKQAIHKAAEEDAEKKTEAWTASKAKVMQLTREIAAANKVIAASEKAFKEDAKRKARQLREQKEKSKYIVDDEAPTEPVEQADV